MARENEELEELRREVLRLRTLEQLLAQQQIVAVAPLVIELQPAPSTPQRNPTTFMGMQTTATINTIFND